MEKEEALQQDYQKTRTELEEQEDTVKRYIRNGQDYTQDILVRVRQLLGKRATSMEPWMQTQRELQRNESDYLEELTKEKRSLIQQQEDVEQLYRKKRQQLLE